MTGKKMIIIALFCAVIAFPTETRAQTTDDSLRIALLQQIIELLEEIKRLQSLAGSTNEPISDYESRYPNFESQFYTGVFTNTYPVESSGTLVSIHTLPANERALWQLLQTIIGYADIRTYIGEVRFYSDEDNRYDAYVEQMPDGKWVFAINTHYVATDSDLEYRLARELFIHEYAHIRIHYEADVLETFTDQFWSDADFSHSARVNRRNTFDGIQSVTAAYYANNQNRFVSDYATINPEEDFAETFLHFVQENRTSGSDTASQKRNWLYSYKDWVSLRSAVRARLGW